ncbi:MAG: AMP-binding protein [Acidobacteria bacterium]|nr:AMP-binding protein [Acidobacteriota bacterium]
MNLVAKTLLGPGRTNPAKVAISTVDGHQMRYADLDRLSGQLANLLVRCYHVNEGDRVAVQSPKCPELLALNIACARIGAIYVPLNTSYTDREIRLLLDDATPSLLVREALIEHDTPRANLGRLVHEAHDQSSHFADVACDENAPAAMLFTSGTTGRAKGALLTHGNLVSNCQTLNEVWGFTPHDTLLHALPLFHTHGLFVGAYCALSSGASMILMENFDAGEVVRQLSSATVFMGVPTYYVRLLAEPSLNRDATAGLRLFTAGSAPLLRATHREFAERTGYTIIERYGMTETGIITSNPIDGSLKVGTVGRALPGVEVRVTGGSPGDVEVKGPNVLIDYWNRPELRETEFTIDGWFKTGDVGIVDEDGYLEIVGRAKDLIITGGYNVYPKELELVLDTFPGVLESAVIGLPDADFGEAVTAIVVPRPGAHLDEAQLGVLARSSFAKFKVPKRFIIVTELPRNAMGKVEKARLRRELSRTQESSERLKPI